MKFKSYCDVHCIEFRSMQEEKLYLNCFCLYDSEKAVLAVTLSNDKEEILGHAAFFDYPSCPEVDPAEWEGWMAQNYNTENSTALNTLFMHYFVAKKEYAHGCAKEIIRTVFNAVPDLHFCFFMAPAGVYPGKHDYMQRF